MSIKTFLGIEIDNTIATISEPLIVSLRHNPAKLSLLTKKQVIAYAHVHDITINTRDKKEEIINIITRS